MLKSTFNFVHFLKADFHARKKKHQLSENFLAENLRRMCTKNFCQRKILRANQEKVGWSSTFFNFVYEIYCCNQVYWFVLVSWDNKIWKRFFLSLNCVERKTMCFFAWNVINNAATKITSVEENDKIKKYLEEARIYHISSVTYIVRMWRTSSLRTSSERLTIYLKSN